MPYGIGYLVNTGSGNGLLPDGTKPLPEPMLTYHQQGPVAFFWWHYHKKIWRNQSVKQKIEDYFFKITLRSPSGQWVKDIDILVQKDLYNVMRSFGISRIQVK